MYKLPFAPSNARSDNGLPFKGPSSISPVIDPVSDTLFLGVSYVKKVTTMGPFSPSLPTCVCPAVTPVMFATFILYDIESFATLNAEISAVPIALVWTGGGHRAVVPPRIHHDQIVPGFVL